MSEIEHTRTLGKVHKYSNAKILLLVEVINRFSALAPSAKMTTAADVGDVLLCLAYSADQ